MTAGQSSPDGPRGATDWSKAACRSAGYAFESDMRRSARSPSPADSAFRARFKVVSSPKPHPYASATNAAVDATILPILRMLTNCLPRLA